MERYRTQDKVRPGMVWLCVEHLEDADADCTCGLVPYLPKAEVEALEQQLAGAVEALERIAKAARVRVETHAELPAGWTLEIVESALAALRGRYDSSDASRETSARKDTDGNL